MKRNKIALAATSGLVGMSVFAGSLAYAATGSETGSAEELQQFLNANPEIAAAIADVEAETGGTVVEAEFDDEAQDNGVVEFEIMMADGSEQELLYTLADGSMTFDEDEDEDEDDEDEDDDN